MRALSSFALGAVTYSTSLAPARADPAYSAENVVLIFLEQKDALKVGKTRALSARENLDQFARALKDLRLAGSEFEIDGHTDAVGSEQCNQRLSERRADAVVSRLASEGIESSLLVAKGFGKSKPRVANPYNPLNRRVETHLSQ